MSETRTNHKTKIDWRWLVVTYCFLVLFHLLPTFLLASDFKELFLTNGIWRFIFWPTFLAASDFMKFFLTSGIWRVIIWTGGGIILVTGYVGRRAIARTILEPGIAAMLYMATLIAASSNIRAIPASGLRLIGLLTALLLIALLLGCFGGAFGRWMKWRSEKGTTVGENSQ